MSNSLMNDQVAETMGEAMGEATDEAPDKPIFKSMLRGFGKRCPQCGKGRLFERYLKPTASCKECGTSYAHIRTDDLAPWATIVVLGHIFVPMVFHVEMAYHPPLWLTYSIALPSILAMILILLPNFKGACVGLMWALGLRGDEQH